MNLLNIKYIDLDALPAYSPWISKLLNSEARPNAFNKTPENILREYDSEKWGALFEKLIISNNPTIEEADRLSYGPDRVIPFYADGKLCVADMSVVHEMHFEFLRTELLETIIKSRHFVELGAGYGTQLFKLASLPELKDIKFTAAEYTNSGIACMKLLGRNLDLTIDIGHCDLTNLHLNAFGIPHNAAFMTCWTMACVKGFSRKTLNELIRYKPSEVIHIEPIYEHWGEESLLHMLWRRYAQHNDYNQSMLTALKQYESEGLIKIVDERPHLFGINPLFPASVIRWKPCEV